MIQRRGCPKEVCNDEADSTVIGKGTTMDRQDWTTGRVGRTMNESAKELPYVVMVRCPYFANTSC